MIPMNILPRSHSLVLQRLLAPVLGYHHLRSECIDQLTKWHKLMNGGAITKEEYEDMHKTIMGNIKSFNNYTGLNVCLFKYILNKHT